MSRTENLTILLSDIVGFTQRTSRQSRPETERMLREHIELLPPLAARFSGRVIKSMGDAFLITFRSPTDAVRCAMAFQDALAEFNQHRPLETQIHIRIALNVGELQLVEGDVYGEAVNVAARIEELTPVDEIYVSEALYLVMNRVEVPSEVVGDRILKGIPEPVRVHRVPARVNDDGEEPILPYGGMHRLTSGPESSNRNAVSPTIMALALVLVTALGVGGWFMVGDTPAPETTAAAPSPGPADASTAEPTGVAQAPAERFVEPAARGTSSADSVATVETDAPVSPLPDSIELASEALRTGQLEKAGELIDRLLANDPGEPEYLMLSGHLSYLRGHRAAGVEAYQQTLAANPALREDKRLIDNLVGSLGWVSKPAGNLLRQYPSEKAVAAIARRTGQSGIHGRHQAVALLKTMGYPNRVDQLGNAMHDLTEEAKCAARRDAVKRLHALGDPRSLAALRGAISLGKNNLKNACLYLDAQAALWVIEGSSSE